MARTKGSKGKYGAEAKAEIIATYHRLGGLQAFHAWAQEHQTEFYKMFASLVPRQVKAEIHVMDESTLTDAELAAIATGSSTDPAEETSGADQSGPVH